MRVLIFSSFHQPAHFVALNLEYLQKSIDKGDEVHYIDCNTSFKECGFNPYKLSYMCSLCKFQEKRGLKLIEGDYTKVSLQNIITNTYKDEVETFISKYDRIEKSIKYGNFEVGESVYSSFISKTRKREFITDEEQGVLKELTTNSILVFKSLKNYIKENKIEKLILFNGRWDYYRAALSAARDKDIEIQVFENYRTGGYSEEFGNNLPHDINTKFGLINSHWENTRHLRDREKIAEKFFINKRNGVAVNDKSYTSDQKKGKLPDSLDSDKEIVVLFNSSDDEFAAIGKEWENPFFEDQLEGILYVTDIIAKNPGMQLVIRMHPNLKGLKRSFLDPIYEFGEKDNNIIVIRPEDDVDTYKLMDVADKVISFGSTAGLEASYWGTPVILLGKSFYFFSEAVYVPSSRNEIDNLLVSNLLPKNKIHSLKFAYYFITGGVKTKYYYNVRNKQYSFKDRDLSKLPLWMELKYKLLKFFKIKN